MIKYTLTVDDVDQSITLIYIDCSQRVDDVDLLLYTLTVLMMLIYSYIH